MSLREFDLDFFERHSLFHKRDQEVVEQVGRLFHDTFAGIVLCRNDSFDSFFTQLLHNLVDALVKKLRDYQDYTGVRVVVVFDGKGTSATEQSEPHSVQVFYSRAGQTADAIIERLASKYAGKFDLTVATSDLLERETASACGADCISIENLRALINEAVPN